MFKCLKSLEILFHYNAKFAMVKKGQYLSDCTHISYMYILNEHMHKSQYAIANTKSHIIYIWYPNWRHVV
jgi:hypothetical protein